MAARKASKKKQKGTHIFLKKLMAGVFLLSFLVIIASGLMAQVRAVTIAYRAAAVLFVVAMVQVVLIRVLSTYEEMNNSGKA